MKNRMMKIRHLALQILITVFSLSVALIPSYVFIFIFDLLGPSSFWQKFAVAVAGIWFLGGIQLVFAGVWLKFFIESVLELN